MRFTNSPFEKMMKQKPRPQAPAPAKPRCVSCYRELLKAPAGGR